MKTIFDPLRKKEVALTPEEGVRQAVIAWLRDTVGIPQVRMQSEWPFRYNGRTFRADVITFDRNLKPEILVECKAPSVNIDSSVIEQVIRYVRVLEAKNIIVTNGSVTLFFTREGDSYKQTSGLK
ncbi:MAG: type I restriction enzyme HsdR N-terminal domain-containing protein [Bacteroidales bacterium]|nr:type I restriction enzyme HsdR N-terminal domain-containing protein [Candidatus Cacconaster caballi]